MEEEEEDNDYQKLLKETKASIRELKEVKKMVAPLLFDLKDGTLKRVAPSRYIQPRPRADSMSVKSEHGNSIDDEESNTSDSQSNKSVRSKQAREIQRSISVISEKSHSRKASRSSFKNDISPIRSNEPLQEDKLIKV